MATSYLSNDTIAAIATPPNGVGAVGIIRISGPKALSAVSKVARPRSRALVDAVAGVIRREAIESHKLYRADFFDRSGKLIDDGMFVFFAGPNSYTGEDSVELNLHGNPRLLEAVLNALVQQGEIRQAIAGEFSFRSFRNGKMDLTQAEAVADLISSRSTFAMERAVAALQGRIGQAAELLREELSALLSFVELDIDFSDQGVSQLNFPNVLERIQRLLRELQQALDRFEATRPLREGIRLAIVGAPNSGKSTLFNRLVGEDRSIVSAQAGTTRDVVRERLEFGRLIFLIADTAGIRSTTDAIEREGIRRSLAEVKGADLCLLLIDASDRKQAESTSVAQRIQELESENRQARVLIVFSKIDSVDSARRAELERAFPQKNAVFLSALAGTGLDVLEERVIALFSSLAEADEGLVLEGSRQADVLRGVLTYLETAEARLIEGNISPDILALDLRAALDTLGDLTGQVSSDDILNLIFSKFCIGK